MIMDSKEVEDFFDCFDEVLGGEVDQFGGEVDQFWGEVDQFGGGS
jgi:class 3 adenylate cyclase